MLQQLQHLPVAIQLGYLALFGLIMGSFLNAVIFRIPLQLYRRWSQEASDWLEEASTRPKDSREWTLSLWQSRSHCPHCSNLIAWYDNIPVVSWLILLGRCRHCQQRISGRYPLVELLTALILVLMARHLGLNLGFLVTIPLILGLIALTFIDLDTQLLPDSITQPLLWLGLLVNSQHLLVTLESAVYGAVAGYLLLWSLYWLFKLTTGKEGMGYGDFKLLAVLGAWMGWQMLPVILLGSALAGTLAGLGYLIIRRRSLAFPFGPYLALAGLWALYNHSQLVYWYLAHG